MDEQFKPIARFYDEIYYRDTTGLVKPSRHLARLAEKLKIKPEERCLDVACGTGEWLLTLARNGAKVSGIDISETAISCCQTNLPDGDFCVGPAETLPFPSSYFDLVSCLGSLEHFLDQPSALAEMVRVTKPGGRVLILVPNAGFPTLRLRLFHGTQQRMVRETIRSLTEWSDLLNGAGLRIISRWKDLHILNWSWIFRPPWYMPVPRLMQGLLLLIWPLNWQYQVYHLCVIHKP